MPCLIFLSAVGQARYIPLDLLTKVHTGGKNEDLANMLSKSHFAFIMDPADPGCGPTTSENSMFLQGPKHVFKNVCVCVIDL